MVAHTHTKRILATVHQCELCKLCNFVNSTRKLCGDGRLYLHCIISHWCNVHYKRYLTNHLGCLTQSVRCIEAVTASPYRLIGIKTRMK